jgi:segregation and condensation protein B
MCEDRIKGAIEAILFVSERPLKLEKIKEVFEDKEKEMIEEAILKLKSEYEVENRGLRIVEVAEGYQLVTNPDYSPILRKFYQKTQSERLSSASLETLAIIAYKQPVTRLDIESIRGCDTSGVLKNLLEKRLICIAGRKNALGRPFVYRTTQQFLEYFGLRTIEDLPKLEEFKDFK